MFVLFGINLMSNAQVCVIKNGDGATVEVFSATIEKNGSEVWVTVGNDSNDISANITVNVTVKYSTSHSRNYTGKTRVEANTSPIIKIPIQQKVGKYPAKSVEVTSITGNRCE